MDPVMTSSLFLFNAVFPPNKAAMFCDFFSCCGFFSNPPGCCYPLPPSCHVSVEKGKGSSVEGTHDSPDHSLGGSHFHRNLHNFHNKGDLRWNWGFSVWDRIFLGPLLPLRCAVAARRAWSSCNFLKAGTQGSCAWVWYYVFILIFEIS